MNKQIIMLCVALMAAGAQSFAQTTDDSKVSATVSSVVKGTTSATSSLLTELASDSPAPTDTTVAKVSPWKFTGIAGLNSSMTGMWNWAAGGNNAVTGMLYGNLTLRYSHQRFVWESNLDTDFGLSFIDNTTYAWRKSNDKINFSTKFGYELKKKWYLTFLGTFKSQYTRGYDYKQIGGIDSEIYTSNWLSPSYTDVSIGIDWKPNDIFSLYLSPAAGRVTTARDSLLRVAYGVDPEKTYHFAAGMTFKGNVNYAYKDFKVISSLVLFTPYNSSFGNVDVDWDVQLNYQLLKMLNISLGTSLKYYNAVMITDRYGNTGPRLQFKTILGVGLGYSF